MKNEPEKRWVFFKKATHSILFAVIGIAIHWIYTIQNSRDSQALNVSNDLTKKILSSEPLESAVITAIDSYQGLLDVAGKVNDAGTGERFEREVIMLLYESGQCEADFKAHNLDIYGRLAPEDVVLVSADINGVDKKFLEKFAIGLRPMACPTAVVIKQRTRIDELKFHWIPYNSDSRYSISTPVLRTQEAHVGTVNDYPFPIAVFYKWNDDPEGVHIPSLDPGREIWNRTFRTTELIAKTLDGKELQRMRVRSHGLFTVADRNCNVEDCGIIERRAREMNQEELIELERYDQFRINNNVMQPKVLPKFTEVGFAKMRVPDEVWDSIITYYRQNKDHPKVENWPKGNAYTNNLEAPSYMVNLPESGPLKPVIFNGIRPILEKWAGVELMATSCYGIRAYTNGSWLSNHVDTRATHAVSVIINVDQEVTEPWPLMIYDHAGNDYNITMEPRDMVLYESATCVHGRPSAFNGKFFANMFVHYKPVDPDKWIKL